MLTYSAPPEFDGYPINKKGHTCVERSLISHLMLCSISLNISTTATVCSKPVDVILNVFNSESKYIAAVNVSLKAI